MSERESIPEHAQLIQMGSAYWASQMLLVAAQLGLADRLGGGPRSAVELARDLELHATSLYRFMRSLAGMGILTQVGNQTFALTALGQALKRMLPGLRVRRFLRWLGISERNLGSVCCTRCRRARPVSNKPSASRCLTISRRTRTRRRCSVRRWWDSTAPSLRPLRPPMTSTS